MNASFKIAVVATLMTIGVGAMATVRPISQIDSTATAAALSAAWAKTEVSVLTPLVAGSGPAVIVAGRFPIVIWGRFPIIVW